MTPKYEVVFYPTEWDEEAEEEVIKGNVPDCWGVYDTEAEAVEVIKKFNGVQLANSYIHFYDHESLEELWNDLWYGDDVIANRNHPTPKA